MTDRGHVSHVSTGEPDYKTVCGARWQDWQQPIGNMDMMTVRLSVPEAGDVIRACPECLQKSMAMGDERREARDGLR